MTTLVLASFGPYLTAGVRTEQAAVYAAAVVALTLVAPLLRPSPHVSALLLIWFGYAVIAVAGAVLVPSNGTRWTRGSVLAGVDNLVLPLGVIVVVLALLARGADPRELVRRAAATIVAMSVVNTLAARAQKSGADWSAFWSPDERSTAINAVENGRYTGLINQPAEAGLIYGIALLSVLYLFRNRPKWMLVFVALTIYGGTMSVSKVFLLIALPIAAWLTFRMAGRRVERVALVFFGAAVFYLLLKSGSLPEFAGANQLRALLPGVGQYSLVERLSAGRYGENAALLPLATSVLREHPVVGFGAGGLSASFDNGWVEALVVAGIVGVFCYTLVLLIVVRSWQAMRPSHERTFLGAFVVLLAGASAGIPALTANRAAPLVWMLLTLLMMSDPHGRTLAVPQAALGRDTGREPRPETAAGFDPRT